MQPGKSSVLWVFQGKYRMARAGKKLAIIHYLKYRRLKSLDERQRYCTTFSV